MKDMCTLENFLLVLDQITQIFLLLDSNRKYNFKNAILKQVATLKQGMTQEESTVIVLMFYQQSSLTLMCSLFTNRRKIVASI